MNVTENPNYESFVNSTYSKPFSPRQILPKYVIEQAQKMKKGCKILDFGAGRDIFGTKIVRDAGFECTAWEIGKNFDKELHDYHALKGNYDIVFASNVMNVQPTQEDVIDVLQDARNCVKYEGYFFCNFPKKPRHCDMNDMGFESILRMAFNRWDKYGNLVEKIAPMVYKCQQKEYRV